MSAGDVIPAAGHQTAPHHFWGQPPGIPTQGKATCLRCGAPSFGPGDGSTPSPAAAFLVSQRGTPRPRLLWWLKPVSHPAPAAELEKGLVLTWFGFLNVTSSHVLFPRRQEPLVHRPGTPEPAPASNLLRARTCPSDSCSLAPILSCVTWGQQLRSWPIPSSGIRGNSNTSVRSYCDD